MTLTPWKLWELHTGKPGKGTRTLEIKAVLEHGLSLDGARTHPGILHMYIHCIEMSPFPEKGLNAADHLRSLVPDGGHMHHMPSHLDVLVGDYRRAMATNYNDRRQEIRCQERRHEFLHLLPHAQLPLLNLQCHARRKKITAFETLDRMEATLPVEYLWVKSPPMADWLEAFFTVRAHVMIGFGMWDDIFSLPLPEDQELFCVATAAVHYAKGIAAAATGNIPVAEEQRRLFQTAYKPVPQSRKVYANRCVDILGVAEAMLDGELNYRKGDYDLAFEQLREAIRRDDNLIYSEPWG
jgi:hypothetical protein